MLQGACEHTNTNRAWLDTAQKLVNFGKRQTGRNSSAVYSAYKCECGKLFEQVTSAKRASLQKLILKSYAARMLAVRQVTQLNAGKRTAGVDGKASLTFYERLNLSLWLRNHYNNWQHQKLREIPIPKKDGKTRILKVPTIADRACLCLVKFAMEPAHEATFQARSYGFRPGRSTHDAQKLLQLNLRSDRGGKGKRVLELDIEKCFDRISHTSIMERLIVPRGIKTGIFRCLKSGVNL